MSHGPRVSVIIPTFQSQSRIARTIGRLDRQTFRDFEIIVVDDGSMDGTAAEVRRMLDGHRRIRLVEQTHQGIGAACNRGIETAHANILAFLDDDDLWLSRKLDLQLAQLEARPRAAVVSCFSALIDPLGRVLGWRFGGETEGDVYREMLEWDMVSGGSVALVARGPLEEVGGFDPSLPERLDWDLWIRLARRHPFTCVPQTLVGYTRRAGSSSRNYESMLANGRKVLAKALREDPAIRDGEHRAWLARDLFGAACLSLVDEQPDVARRYLTQSLRSGPRIILKQPRRWGIIGMLILSAMLPERAYHQAVTAMSRVAFGLQPGIPFDSLESTV